VSYAGTALSRGGLRVLLVDASRDSGSDVADAVFPSSTRFRRFTRVVVFAWLRIDQP